ncbi:MAG TPA: hypothetical protein VEL76_32825 [Gemmataceae bacterium]|nr:hypothetical protein [Gemmataceae bacterium]
MSTADDSSDSVRQQIISAFESRKWEFTGRALREGLDAFRRYSENPSEDEMVDYILDLLESGFPLRCVELHDPPYGEGHELVNADGRGLYIKLKLDWPYVIVMSFHY